MKEMMGLRESWNFNVYEVIDLGLKSPVLNCLSIKYGFGFYRSSFKRMTSTKVSYQK